MLHCLLPLPILRTTIEIILQMEVFVSLSKMLDLSWKEKHRESCIHLCKRRMMGEPKDDCMGWGLGAMVTGRGLGDEREMEKQRVVKGARERRERGIMQVALGTEKL